MLSIGKLAAGQAKYYLDHAEVRVDVVDSVEGGLEEYYVGGREARGVWLGRGSARLGLHGGVEGEQLRRVLGGVAPADGCVLRASASPVRVAGFDLTFSAPKSVSVVFGVGDRDTQSAVRRAHDRAVVEAVTYVEREAAAVRRGAGGAVVAPADGLVAAAFRHRTSRAGDPQLHTHVLVANLGLGPDGRWSALDGRRLYAHARTASFIYQAVLRSELTRELGLAWMPVRQGIAELVGVPKPVIKAFSRRRAEIEAALADRGVSSARAAEAAALATRRPKDRGQAVEALIEEWRERAAGLGFDVEKVLPLADRSRSQETEERTFARLAGPMGLTQRRSTFTRRDVLQALCERVPPGQPVDLTTLEATADRFLGSQDIVPLAAALLGDLRRYDRPLPERCVLVVDEAGMVPTRQLATMLEHVERVDGKLVLVGDHRQLPAIEAGGAFRALVQRGLATELQENRRQVERWERAALELVREGHAQSALPLYEAQGRLHVGTTDDDTRGQVVRAWRAAGDLDEAVMIARRRDDVTELNDHARRHLRAAGALGDVELAAPGGAFAVGDRVVVKLNDFRLGVHNGDRGQVVGVEPHSLRVELRGRTIRLDARFLTDRTTQGDPTLVHGYAITGHVAQGLTVDRAFVLADDGMNREWAAMSRGRLSNHLYIASEPGGAREEFAPSEAPRDPLQRLTAALKRSDEPRLAIDHHPQRAETRHAALRFVDEDEIDRRAAASWDRIAERRAQRDRGPGFER